jgi:hypothetical protein
MSRISDKTQTALAQFLRDVKSLGNESSKTHRFAALLGELFPGTKVATEFAEGTEKLIRVDTSTGEKRRRIDAYYGNAIIEFEADLEVTGKEAERQLREYTTGVWNKEGKNRRHLIPIASDGLTWKTYRPFVKKEGWMSYARTGIAFSYSQKPSSGSLDLLRESPRPGVIALDLKPEIASPSVSQALSELYPFVFFRLPAHSKQSALC